MGDSNFPKMEEELLDFWDKNKIFQKSIDQRPAKRPYVFYDGPPFATGLPHYGHIVASVMKDMVPRFWTMRGYRVERRWGWDCHGLPIENIVESQLKLATKKEILRYGIDRFNESCRACVLTYTEEWKKTIRRIGRFVDMEHDYKTMNPDYMESVWWVFKSLWDKGLVYQDYKSMHICPRCETPLSNFEVTQGYKEIDDLSVTVKFKLANGEYLLAWTTTPWTLPGNVLLAVGPNIIYRKIKINHEILIMAKDRAAEVLKDTPHDNLGELKGSELVGLTYEPLFPYFKNTPRAFRVVAADFVTTTDGTGVVHIAPAFGEDDFQVGQREKVPIVQHVDMSGRFTSAVTDFAGREAKPKDNPQSTDVEILKWLASHQVLFSKQKIKHAYPHCWRCDSPLLNYLTNSWFIKVTAIKDQMIKNNKKVSWVPEHIKEGRFGKWLADARDWAVSRNRFWGTPLPIWQSADGKHFICVGSIAELESLSGQVISDLHKHLVDKIVFKKNGQTYARVPEVLDCWFESGSMPYAERHYPFENKNKFKNNFPAQFIAEGQDQTRGWFYTLMVIATALFKQSPFENVVVNGIVLAEDGQKMSKRLKNYPDPWEIFNTYSVDALRYYLMSSPVVKAENLNFSEKGVKEIQGRVLMIMANVLSFYELYAGQKRGGKIKKSEHALDRWIDAKLQQLIKTVTNAMERYDLINATRPLGEFINDLSTWYIRRSRERLKSEDVKEAAQALNTLHSVLLTLSKLLAPVMPFMAEKIFQALRGHDDLLGKIESVHLADWPEYRRRLADPKIIDQMTQARQVVEAALALRSSGNLKVRQPLAELAISGFKLTAEVRAIIGDEINVKKITLRQNLPTDKPWISKFENGFGVALNTAINQELRRDGALREIIHAINMLRKDAKLTVNDLVEITLATTDQALREIMQNHENKIKKEVLARQLILKDSPLSGIVQSFNLDGQKIEVIINR